MPTIDRDGVALYYDEDGVGDPPMLLVHGWCCDHTYFAPQSERFKEEHRVVTVDLRGHGRSDKPEQDYTMSGFADDLASLCEELDLADPVVVGHSMGGVIAMELAARHRDLPAAIVALDAPLPPMAPAAREALGGLVHGLESPDFRQVALQFVERMFMEEDDPDVKARVTTEMSSAPQHVMASAMEQIVAWDGESAARACQVPVLNLTSSGPQDTTGLTELCPHVVYGQTVGAGHFHQLLVPDQVNAMIERFIAISLPAIPA